MKILHLYLIYLTFKREFSDKIFRLQSSRNKTLELVKSLNAEDMMVQANDYVSPIKWHLAHTTWFFEKFVLKKKKYKIFSKSFDFSF